MYDHLPAFRPDVAVLFGKELPKLGIQSDLLGQLASGRSVAEAHAWPAGQVFLHGRERKGILGHMLRPLLDVSLLWRVNSEHRLIQVRDKIRTGLIALLYARVSGRKMAYWMSFPFVEGFRIRHEEIGRRQGLLVWLVNGLRAVSARSLYYGFLAARVDHLFVQSDAMLEFMAGKGVARARMTAVPMGVDAAHFKNVCAPSVRPSLFEGRQVIAYLGVLSRSRKSEFLLDVLAAVRASMPNAFLLLAGDAASEDEQIWFREQIAVRGLSDHVWLTGWLPQAQALPLLKCAALGLSPFPRDYLFDTNSPTKAIEYLALGIPCVGNENPDQRLVLESSEGGLCVPMDVTSFRDAALKLLSDPEYAKDCGVRGQAWVAQHRSYQAIAAKVAAVYQQLLAR
ncbi:glycosyltransferase [Kinneretia aquatilis]|nr:glycosyltransferase [Paucibacter aquatile]